MFVLLGGLVLYPCVAELLPMGTGSLEYAHDWSARLRSVQSVEEAQTRYPEVRARKFSNGDWILVVSANSHGNPWGGTVVTKDNHGVVRSFYGHVCGRVNVGFDSESLDDVYRELDYYYASTLGSKPRRAASE